MSLWGFITGQVRDKVAEPVEQHIGRIVLFGLPIGALAASALFLGRGYLTYLYLEKPEAIREIAEALEKKGYRRPHVTHGWFARICLKGRVSYVWSAENGNGTACSGGFLGPAIHVKRGAPLPAHPIDLKSALQPKERQ